MLILKYGGYIDLKHKCVIYSYEVASIGILIFAEDHFYVLETDEHGR